MLATSIILFFTVVISTEAVTTTITTCPNYVLNWIPKHEKIPEDLAIQTENEIADQGHFSGLTPLEYALEIMSLNLTHYLVKTDLEAKVIKTTQYLMFNVHTASPNCAFEQTTIRVVTTDEDLSGACMDKFTFVERWNVYVIHLTKELPANSACTIHFGNCFTKAYDTESNVGAKGLRLSRHNQSEAVYSNFHMRYARTAFPCMDHPSLKATFDLCLVHFRTFSVASSMQAMPRVYDSQLSHQYIRTCFHRTPPIAPSSLSFALTKSYEIIVSEDSKFSLLVPLNKSDHFQWILSDAKRTVSRMTVDTSLALPFSELQFLIVYPEMSLGAKPFGLVTLNGTEMEREPVLPANRATLYRAIVKQWLGNIVTVSRWNEVCLQDGLVTYMGWMFVAASSPSSWIIEQAQRAVVYGMNRQQSSSLKKYLDANGTSASSADCHLLAPLIFYNIHQRFGYDFVVRLLRQLISSYSNGNAGLNEWDKALEESHKSLPYTPRSYLTSWFSNPLPLKLLIWKDQNRLIRDGNGGFALKTNDSDAALSRSVFVQIYCSTWTETFVPLAQVQPAAYGSAPPPRWCLVDPEGVTLTYKIYDVTTYKNFLEDPIDNSGPLTEKRLERFLQEFCTSLLNDFIFPKDPRDKETWLHIFELALRDIKNDTVCGCCVTPPDKRDAWCSNGAQQCDRISLVKFVFPTSAV